jgi:alanyl-tRNA synthetase
MKNLTEGNFKTNTKDLSKAPARPNIEPSGMKYMKIKKGDILKIILDETPFFPESGGQECDIGYITGKDYKLKVIKVKKYGDLIIHKCIVEQIYED